MQISQKNLSKQLSKNIEQQLSTAISELRDNDAARFIRDFFTDTERMVLMKRLAIGCMLQKKKSYEEIKQTLNVSSATISTVAEMLKQPGFSVAVSKVHEDEWAENALNSLNKLFGRK